MIRRLSPLILFCLLISGAAEAKLTVKITGLKGELKANAEGYLTAKEYLDRDDLGELFIRQIYQRGSSEITEALQPYGYYQPAISGSVEKQSGNWLLSYDVEPGKKSSWRRISVNISGEGAQNPDLQNIISTQQIWPGQPVTHQKYKALKDALERTALQLGYLQARWLKHRLKVAVSTGNSANPVDVNLHLDTGPRFYFGDVNFSDTPLKSGFLNKFIPFESGQVYNANQLRKLQYHLRDSRYFNNIRLIPDFEHVTETKDGKKLLPVNAQLNMRKRNKYSFAAGYGTDTGVRGSIGWQGRWLNSRGHRLGTKLQASEVGAEGSIRYTIPLSRPIIDTLSFVIKHESEDIETKTEQTSVNAIWSVQRNAWRWQFYSKYLHEEFVIGSNTDESDLLIFGLGAERRRADNLSSPKNGYRFSWDIHGAHDSILSNTSFLQLNLNYKYLKQLNDHWRFHFRNQLGANLVTTLNQVPLSERYFAGGDQSIRGFKYNTVATRDTNGDLVGGQYLAVASGEFEYQFENGMGLALFADAGNAFDTTDEGTFKAVGIGFRYKLPVGSLRLDIGVPVDSDESPRLHLSLGPDL